MLDNLQRMRREERNSYTHRQYSRQKKKKRSGREKETELYTQTALTAKEEDGVEKRRKKSYTHRQHSRQKKKKKEWNRERNIAIHTTSTHSKRRRWGARERETEL